MKLFFITYAGGSAGFFNGLTRQLADDFECIPIEYAGHFARSREPFYGSFQTMVEDVASAIKGRLESGEHFAVLGYSMGSLVAYEALSGPLKEYKCERLFVAAHYPPDTSKLPKKYSEMTDDELCGEMRQFGGMDARIVANKRFLDIYLALVRKDYQLLESYVFNGEKRKISCGITVFYSQTDTAYSDMEGWRDYTAGETVFHRYNGNHFFLKGQENAFANDIRAALA